MTRKLSIPLIIAMLLVAASSSSPHSNFQLPLTARGESQVTLNVLGGEVNATIYGYSLDEKGPLLSPGSTIKVKEGSTVTINFKNIGGEVGLPHTFVVVTEDGTPMFENSRIGTKVDPIDVGKSGSTTFTVDKSGEFFYICEVPGHKKLGMWGKFIIEPSLSSNPPGY